MARSLIRISVKAGKVDVRKVKTDVLAVPVFEGTNALGEAAKNLDKALGGWISKIMKVGDFKAKPNTDYVLYGDKKIGAVRVLLVGMGERKKVKVETLRGAAANAAARAVRIGAGTAVLALHEDLKDLDPARCSQAMAEAVFAGAYRYDELMSESGNGSRPSSLRVTLADASAKDVTIGAVIGENQNLVRTFGNRPANLLYPEVLAAEARKIANKVPGLTCRVFKYKDLQAKKMNAIVAVGRGSEKKPCLIEIKYTPAKTKKNTPLVGLVGKAITFDSGGISIKPGAGMHEMKMDKCGGIAVLGAIKTIAELRLPVAVRALICSAENMPGGASYRPGDVITTYSGKTVEVQNTDAEGRLVMCDGIHYAKELKCEVVIDMATLTGACVVALGQYKAGLFSNTVELSRALQTAAEKAGEPVWPLPCGDEYAEEMKSEVADLKNIGSKWGGACTAASFLREFAGDEIKWAHIDIAGPGMYDPAMKSHAGARAFGMRILTEYVRGLAE